MPAIGNLDGFNRRRCLDIARYGGRIPSARQRKNVCQLGVGEY